MLYRVINRLRHLAQKRLGGYHARRFEVLDFDDPLPCLWSKGIARMCDVRGPDWYWCAPTESVQPDGFFQSHDSHASGLVWVRLGTRARDGLPTDLDRFASEALPSIRQPFVLVTSDGDASVPQDLNPRTVAAIFGSPWLAAWYSQNAVGLEFEKLKPLPIGLDLHTPRSGGSPRALLRQLADIRAGRTEAGELPPVAFCDFGLSLASAERIAAMRTLRGCPHVEVQRGRVSQKRIWQHFAAHPFVLSAEGNGMDCHRTWEALYLGSIVITKTSPLDRMFRDLPVVIVDSWDEVLSESNLRTWQKAYAPLTSKSHVWSALRPAVFEARMRQDLSVS